VYALEEEPSMLGSGIRSLALVAFRKGIGNYLPGVFFGAAR
jgi:hypothetical protein